MMFNYLPLISHFVDGLRWRRLSPVETRRRQVMRFRRLFEHARAHSPFYRRLYKEAGIEKLVIRSMADVERVPLVDKAMLRSVPPEELLTRPISPDLVRVTTSGSSGEPFVIYLTRTEQYTSHVRVFTMLWELGWRPWQRILALWRLEPGAVLPVEQDLGLLTRLRKGLGLFQREIASVYTPVPDVVRWLDAHRDAPVFWSTPGVVTALCDYLEAQGLRYDFDLVVLTSETLSAEQRLRFGRRLGGPVVSHYGLMECPTIGHDPGDDGHFRIQSQAALLEIAHTYAEGDLILGEVVLTNLVNHTMPFIRYRTGDTTTLLNRPDSPAQVIGPVLGRMDDVITLPNNEHFAYHHSYAMFMDFVACTQYKFVQYPDSRLALHLRLQRDAVKEDVRAQALARWQSRYPAVPLAVEFVETMPIDPKTGKFKVIERLGIPASEARG